MVFNEKKMRYLFRTDSSDEIGLGHVMRCLTLADKLRKNESNVLFVCRDLRGSIIDLVEKRCYKVHVLGKKQKGGSRESILWDEKKDAKESLEIINIFNPEWIIVDHYKLGFQWEMLVGDNARRIMVIDDLPGRKHNCNLLLDQNLRRNAESRYRKSVPKHCELYLGPKNVMLGPYFDKPKVRTRDGRIKNVLLYLGSNDATNQTETILRALVRISQLNICVVLGRNHPFEENIVLNYKKNPKIIIYNFVKNIAEIMEWADIAIGTCGITTWERCALGLPTMVCITAENQVEDSIMLDKLGAVMNLGQAEELNTEIWFKNISYLIEKPEKIVKMGIAALGVVDGYLENSSKIIKALTT